VTERVGIQYDITGASQGAEQIERLGAAVQATDRQVSASGEQIEALTRAMTTLTQATTLVAEGQGGVARATRESAEATTNHATAAIAFVQRFQAATAAIEAMSSAFGGHSDEARLLGRTAQSIASFAQLGATLGPQGSLVGGIIGAAIPAFQQMEEAQQGNVDMAARLTRSLDDIISASERAYAAETRRQQLERGQGTPVAQAAFATESSNRVGLITAALGGDAAAIRELRRQGLSPESDSDPSIVDRLMEAAGGQAAVHITERERARLEELRQHAVSTFEQRLQLVGVAIDDAEKEVASGGGNRGQRRQGGGGARARGPTDDQRFRTLVAGLAGGREGEQDAELGRQNGTAAGIGQFVGGGQGDGPGASRADEQRRRGIVSLQALERHGHEERMRQQREYLASIQDELSTLDSLGQKIGSTFAVAFESAISGQEDFGTAFAKGSKQVLMQLGEQYIAEGAGALLTAAGNLILNPPAAASKAIEGAGKLALGVGLGAAGAAIPTPSAGGAGDSKAASPHVSSSQGGGSNRAQPPIVINMNAPSVIGGTTLQWGRDAQRSIQQARQRYG